LSGPVLFVDFALPNGYHLTEAYFGEIDFGEICFGGSGEVFQ